MLGEFGEVLLMDWGVSLTTGQFAKGSLTAASPLAGTPAYMAPEMATGPLERIGPLSDVYLLGAVLYEIVASHPPHTGQSALECLHAVARNEIVPTEKSGELIDLARRAMSTDPAARFAGIVEFQQAIRAYRSHAESIVLADRGDQEFAAGEANRDYRAYARAMSCYEESLALWPGFARAKESLDRANLAYAECALEKGDHELGLSLLAASNPAHRPLRKKLAQAQREQATRQQRIASLKRVAVLLLLCILVGALAAVGLIQSEANRARRAENEANVNLIAAQQATKKANDALGKLADANVDLKQQRDAATAAETKALAESDRANREKDAAQAAADSERRIAYVAQINLAAEKIAASAFGQARQQLEGPAAEDKVSLRHWEWGRLKYLLSRDRLTLTFPGGLMDVAASADGTLVLVGGEDGAAVILNSATGAHRFELNHDAPIGAVAISPDGGQAAIGGADGSINIWELPAELAAVDSDWPISLARETARQVGAHDGAVHALAFSRDGRRLLSASADRSVRLWDAISGGEIGGFFGHLDAVRSAAFSPDEERIVSAGDDGSVAVWSTDTRHRLVRFHGHKGPVCAAVFSPDGTCVISAGDDRRVLSWRPENVPAYDYSILLTGGERKTAPFEVLGTHDAPIRSLRFSRDGQRLATAGDDARLKIWTFERLLSSAADSRLRATLRGHLGPIRSCIFLEHADSLVSAGQAGELKFWNAAEYSEVEVLHGHEGEVASAEFAPDGKTLATASRDRTAIVWDAATGRQLARLHEGHAFLAAKAVFSPDGTSLFTAAADNSVRMWDVQTGGEQHAFLQAGRAGAMALSADATLLATGGTDEIGNAVCKLWDVSTGQLQFSLPHDVEVTALAFSPHEPLLLIGDADGVRRLWRFDEAAESWKLERTSNGHRGRIVDAAFTPDGQRVLTASLDRTVGSWNVATGDEPTDAILKHGDSVLSLAVSPAGRFALTATADGEARLWRIDDAALQRLDVGGARPGAVAFSTAGEAVVVVDERRILTFEPTAAVFDASGSAPALAGEELTLAAHAGAIWSAAFSLRDNQLVTIGGDHALLWNAADGALLHTFSPHGRIVSARYSADGKLLVTGGGDDSAKIWRLDSMNQTDSRVVAKVDRIAALGRLQSASFADIRGMDVGDAQQHRLLLAGTSGLAMIVDPATSRPLVTFEGHPAAVNDARPSHDGRFLVTASNDGTARICSAATGELLHILGGDDGHTAAVLAAAFSSDGRRVITAGGDATAKVWNTADGRLLVTLSGHASAVNTACFSHDGRRALTASDDRTAKVWLLEPSGAPAGKELLTLRQHDDAVTSAAFSPDDRTVVTTSRDGAAILWRSVAW
jgi:hypothetical protein